MGTAALLITLSRTAILLWVIYLIVLFGLWLAEKYKKHKFNPLQIFLSLLIMYWDNCNNLLLQNNYILQRFLTTNLSDESIVQRQDLITQSLKMFWQSPIFGVGINNYFNNLNFIYQKKILSNSTGSQYLSLGFIGNRHSWFLAIFLFDFS